MPYRPKRPSDKIRKMTELENERRRKEEELERLRQEDASLAVLQEEQEDTLSQEDASLSEPHDEEVVIPRLSSIPPKPHPTRDGPRFVRATTREGRRQQKAQFVEKMEKAYNEEMSKEEDDLAWTPEDEAEVQKELRAIQEAKGKGGKRAPAQVLLDRAEVARYMRRGWSMDMIAEKMECSIQQVEHDWKMVLNQANRYKKEDTEAKKQAMLEQYSELMREAWEAWERSKLDEVGYVTEVEKSLLFKPSDPDSEDGDSVPTPEGSKLVPVKRKTRKTRSGRNPGAEYLKIIQECLKNIANLEGLNAAKQLNVKGTLDWDVLISTEVTDHMSDDQEAKLVQAMGYGGDVYDKVKQVECKVLPEGKPSSLSQLTQEEHDALVQSAISGRANRQ